MSSVENPLITIVIAVLNGAAALQRSIDSIAAQTYLQRELIIMDGGSDDGTLDLLRMNQSEIAYFESKPDNGIYHAWNKALMRARGEWVYFLGAGDYFLEPGALSNIVPYMKKAYPPKRIVYTKVAVVNSHGETLFLVGSPWSKIRKKFLQVMCLPHQGVFHHHSIFQIHGQFDSSFRISGDYELLLRELKTNEAVFVPDMILAAMNNNGVSNDPEKSMLLLQEALVAQKRHGYRFPGKSWLSSYLKVKIRMFLWNVFGEKTARYVLDLGRICIGKSRYWTRA